MNPASKDIAQIIHDDGSLGLVLATNLYYYRTPNNPINCVTVFDIFGNKPLLTLSKNTSDYHFPRISMQFRNSSYETAYTQALDVSTLLHGMAGIGQGGVKYILIRALEEPQPMEYDKNNRAIILINFEIHRK